MKITIEEMLVERDIISRQQLERVKEIQKSHEDKSLTEYVASFGIYNRRCDHELFQRPG